MGTLTPLLAPFLRLTPVSFLVVSRISTLNSEAYIYSLFRPLCDALGFLLFFKINAKIATVLASSRLSVSRYNGKSGWTRNRAPALSRVLLVTDPACHPPAFSIVPTDQQPGAGYDSTRIFCFQAMGASNFSGLKERRNLFLMSV